MAHQAYEPYPHPLFAPPLRMPLLFRGRKGRIGYKRKRSLDSATPPAQQALYPAGHRLTHHAGVDLLASDGDPVFAVDAGEVLYAANESTTTPDGVNTQRVGIAHHPRSLGYVSRYLHLRSVFVAKGDVVEAGQVIGTTSDAYDPAHLHFELRRLVDPSDDPGNRQNLVIIDPTRLLYRFEAERHPIDLEPPSPPVLNPPKEATVGREYTDWDDLKSAAVVDWEDVHLFEAQLEDADESYFLPLYEPTEHERRMMELLESALVDERRVKLAWIPSRFFGERKMIYRVRVGRAS